MSNMNSTAPSRLDSVGTASPSTLSPSRINEDSALPVQEATEAVNTAQRNDRGPLQRSLKAAIDAYWGEYTEALSLFLQGRHMVFVRAL